MDPDFVILLIQFFILLLSSIVVMISVYHSQHKILWHFPIVATIGTLFIDDGFITPFLSWRIKPVWIVILIFIVACPALFKTYLVNTGFWKSILAGVGIGIITFIFAVLIRGVDRMIGNASSFSIWDLVWQLITVVLKEEIIFRVYLFVYIMERGVSFRTANLVQATLFTTFHFWRYLAVDDWSNLIVLFISSLIVGYAIHKYKNYACGFSEHFVLNGGSLVLYFLSSLF